jgi:hypothetical protein
MLKLFALSGSETRVLVQISTYWLELQVGCWVNVEFIESGQQLKRFYGEQ